MPGIPSQKDFTVAIVGGGICGLSCAIILSRAGLNVKLFERTSRFEEIGAGIGLGPNAVRALKLMGLLDPILEAVNVADLTTQTSIQFVQGTGSHELIYDLPDVNPNDKGNLEKTGFGIYRPTFLDALLPLIDPNVVCFLKRLTLLTTSKSGAYRLHFSDNTTYDADVVIGADGIKSTVRNSVAVPDEGLLAFSNRYIYRDRVSIEDLKALGVKGEVYSRLQAWLGNGKQIVTFPVNDHTILSITAAVNVHAPGMPPSTAIPAPWVQDVDQEELLKAYEPEFGGDILAIIRLMTRPKRWALHMIYPPLKTYVKDRIALIGDAAHAMVPFIGAGAGQGFEDVYTICRILSHPKVTKSRLSDALVVYDNYRRPLANKTLEQSLVAGDNLECFIPGGEDVTRQRIRMMYEDQWIQNLWHHDFDEEVTKILEEF